MNKSIFRMWSFIMTLFSPMCQNYNTIFWACFNGKGHVNGLNPQKNALWQRNEGYGAGTEVLAGLQHHVRQIQLQPGSNFDLFPVSGSLHEARRAAP